MINLTRKWLMLLAILPFQAGALPAFPGAEGWGANSIGGRGGQVIHVTSLNTSGPGTLSAAVQTAGSKIIVFDLGGVIDLRNYPLWLNSNTTIAGQTAPGGITLINGGIYGDGVHDVIVRFLRVRRSADAADGDCFRFAYGAHEVILDHCSGMWNSDENIDLSSNTYNVTFQHCVIASPGQCFEHYGSGSGYGNNRTLILASKTGGRITFYKNLLAHSMKRTPAMQNNGTSSWQGTTFEFINNVFYNCMQGSYETFDYGNTCPLNLIANYYKSGPSAAYPSSAPFAHAGTVPPAMFVHAEYNYNAQFPYLNVAAGFFRATTVLAFVDTIIAPQMTMVIDSVQTAYQEVTTTSGPMPHDAADTRVLNEARTGTGAWQESCDPLPEAYRQGTGPSPADTDKDGMPDSWENAHSLNPANGSDHLTDMGGYNAVEVYLNELADSLINAGATMVGEATRFVLNSGNPLVSAFPNPFKNRVDIELTGIKASRTQLRVFNIKGELVAELKPLAQRKSGARYQWSPKHVSSGIYLVRAAINNKKITKKIFFQE